MLYLSWLRISADKALREIANHGRDAELSKPLEGEDFQKVSDKKKRGDLVRNEANAKYQMSRNEYQASK